MRIAIDARMMGAETSRGIGRYIQELTAAMIETAPGNRYAIIARSPSHPFANNPSVETIVADIPWYGLKEQLRMPSVLRSAKADVVFLPHWNVPFFYRGPLIVTIHDLLLRHFPHSSKASIRNPIVRFVKRLGYRLIMNHAIKTARAILVPSNFTAQDAARFYPKAKDKIIVTGEGMPQLEARRPDIPTTASGVGISTAASGLPAASYLLYVGSAYPHKGLQDLLSAWKVISAQHSGLRLKIAGEMDAFMRRLKRRSDAERLPRIQFMGKVSDAELADLYRGAAALVFPSHFEGFGLPPLEALVHGCPVISSDAGALPETLGQNGAIFFRAGDPDGIIAAVRHVLADPKGASQKAFQAASELARRHDWKSAARFALDAMRHSI